MERNTTQKMLPSRARDAPLEREEDSRGTEQPSGHFCASAEGGGRHCREAKGLIIKPVYVTEKTLPLGQC